MDVAKTVKETLLSSFPALMHKNFRYYWYGVSISLIGTWMQNISLPWLAYSLTNSPFLLSLVGTLQYLPMLFLSVFAGVIVDRFPKKRLLIITQILAMLIAAVLALLVWTGYIRYWQLLVLGILLGLINTLAMPVRQSYMIELVGRDDLMNAIALNSSIFNLARIIGPAVAGLLMGYMGVAVCFFINAVSFIPLLIGLLLIDADPAVKIDKEKSSMLKDIKEGFVYIYNNVIVYKAIILVAIASTFAMNNNVLLPVLVKNVLHQNEAGFGFLMSSMGLGSFLGAVALAARSKSGPRGYVLYGGPVTLAIFLIATGFTGVYYLTAVLLALVGFCFVTFTATANSMVQLNSKDEFRGRVMSIYLLVFGGTTPIGNLFTGSITNKYGPQAGFIACGMAILVLMGMLWLLKRKAVIDNSVKV